MPRDPAPLSATPGAGHGRLSSSPPEELVVGGLYRSLRNPMYVGVGLVIAAQCLAFRSPALVVWPALFTVAVAVFAVVPRVRTRDD